MWFWRDGRTIELRDFRREEPFDNGTSSLEGLLDTKLRKTISGRRVEQVFSVFS